MAEPQSMISKAHSDGRSQLIFRRRLQQNRKILISKKTSAENAADCGRLNEPLLSIYFPYFYF